MMKMPFAKRILSPVDFSARSEHAVRYAAALARRFEAELILVHVLEPLSLDYSMVDPDRSLFENVIEKRQQRARAQLDAFVPEASGALRILEEGDAADQILSTASRQDADLIVMPTQGHSRIRRFIVGSVTAKVLHDSPIPVWTGVHLDYEQNFPELRLRNILCAVDFGPQAPAVLESGAHLARAFGAAVSVVHVCSAAGVSVFETSNLLQSVEDRLRKLVSAGGFDARCYVEHGDAHKAVPAKARDLAADLVVIGRGCSQDVAGRLRAQAYGIIRQAPCPVLSI
jgi:nucleotide-binding universal stress UspA family protein